MEYVEPNLVKLSGSDFHLEEPRQDIRGFDVYDRNGDKVGTVGDFYIDREAHVTRFLDVKAGGFLGIGKRHFLLPVEEVTRNVYGHYGRPVPEGSSTTKITREQVAATKESGDTTDGEESHKEGGDGVIAAVAKKAGKGAAKGAVKG